MSSLTPLPAPVPAASQPCIVTAETFRMLQLGDLVIQETRTRLPYGAGNIARCQDRSGGKAQQHASLARTAHYAGKQRFAKNPRNETARRAAIAITAQGGNCAEHADIAAVLLNELAPVGTRISVCCYTGLDHLFVVIGDLSGPREDLVVVDPWPPEARSVRLADHAYGTAGSLRIKRAFDADGLDVVAKRLARVTGADGNALSLDTLDSHSGGCPDRFGDITATRNGITQTYAAGAPDTPAPRMMRFTHLTRAPALDVDAEAWSPGCFTGEAAVGSTWLREKAPRGFSGRCSHGASSAPRFASLPRNAAGSATGANLGLTRAPNPP